MGFRLILGLAFALLMGNAQNQPFGKRDALRGAVRTVTAERARLLHGTEPKELARQKVEVIAFDRKGRPTERSIYSDYGFYMKFDVNGNTTEVAYYDARGLLKEKWLFGYDGNKANPSWEARYNADGSLRRKLVHSYELDPEGNWIKRTSAVMTISPMGPAIESTFVTYRTITYY